jgi:glycosyltransferase involved in cell wall biosynthesis
LTASAVLGVQGAQSSSNFARGIARYIDEHSRALVRVAPQVVKGIDADPLRPPPQLAPEVMRLAHRAGDAPPAADVYHVMSPFEEIPLQRVWPDWARSAGLAVTLYDLIPLLYREPYLVLPQVRRYYLRRLQMLAAADGLLAISRSAGDDAVTHLGVDPARVFVISGGCSDRFRPPDADPAELLRRIGAALPAVRPGYVLYVGGVDHRKNVEGLVAAYARLAPDVRRAHQLVIACTIAPGEANALRKLASRVGVAGDMLLTGYVSDDLLPALYQAADLMVSPSFYEGFGLTVLEGLRSGTVVLASDIGPHRELVPEAEARFDPADGEAIVAALQRGLQDPDFRARRREVGQRQAAPFTWDRVAELTVAAYAELAARRSTSRMTAARG